MPAVRVDGLLIEQTLINLLENAAEIIPPTGSHILIGAKQQNANGWRSPSRDNGPGIPSNQEKHIFDKFLYVRCPTADLWGRSWPHDLPSNRYRPMVARSARA